MTSQLDKVSLHTRDFIASDQTILINGVWVNPKSGRFEPVIDPSTGEEIGEYSPGDKTDVEAAISAAKDVFEAGVWTAYTPAERTKFLIKIADLIEANQQILGELESLDSGKPIGPARYGEVLIAAEAFRYHAGWCTKIEGRTFQPSIPGLDLMGSTRLEPVGVAGLITPWNGPLVMAAWKLAPALAAGCCCVLKPSENTVLSTLFLGRLMLEAGIPPGVVNIVTGSGAVVGGALSASPDVDKLSFTGSIATARRILDATKGNFKKLSLELGGKSPVVIFADVNMDSAVEGATGGIFGNAGQVCVAGSRILIQRKFYDAFVEKFTAAAKGLKLGASMHEDTEMGPLISDAHRQSVANIVTKALEGKAELLTGGSPLDRPGFFFEPTLIASSDRTNCIVTDEVFGPVAVVMPFEDEVEAIALANNSDYGLAASVWTENTSRAQRMSQKIKAGIVWINCHGIPDMAMPIGGYKQSGWGREHGWHGIEAYLEHKSIMQHLI